MEKEKKPANKDWDDYLFTKPVWFTTSIICFILLLTTDWTGPGVEKPSVLLMVFVSLIAPGVLYFIASSVIGILGSVGFFGYVVAEGALKNKKVALVTITLIFGPTIIATAIGTDIAFAIASFFYLILFFVFMGVLEGWKTIALVAVIALLNLGIAAGWWL